MLANLENINQVGGSISVLWKFKHKLLMHHVTREWYRSAGLDEEPWILNPLTVRRNENSRAIIMKPWIRRFQVDCF
jgi:hypothetical protein